MAFRNLAFVALTGLAVSQMEAQPLQVLPVAAVPSSSYLGVGTQDVTAEHAKALKLPEEAGVEVTKVQENTPASMAGLQVGDVIMQYNGQRVEGGDQFQRLVRETPVGRDVKLLVYRNGSPQTITARIGSRPLVDPRSGLTFQGGLIPGVQLPPSAVGTVPDVPLSWMSWGSGRLGWEVASIDGQLAEFFGVKEGVLVRSVMKGSVAEKAGLKAGDVIIRVGDAKVTTAADLSVRLRAGRSQSAALTVVRDKREISVTVPLDGSAPGERF